MDMEQRQPVDQSVLGAPLPRLGQRVQVRGDRGTAEDHTLGSTRGPRGVKNQRRTASRRHACRHGLGRGPGRRTAGEIDLDEAGTGIGQDMAPFGRAGIGRQRHTRHPGQKPADHSGHRLQRSGGIHRERGDTRPVEIQGHRPRRTEQFLIRSGTARDGHGIRTVPKGTGEGGQHGGGSDRQWHGHHGQPTGGAIRACAHL